MTGSQEATSKLRVGRTTDYRRGTHTELLAFRHGGPTTLVLLCGESFGESAPAATQALRSGSFSVHMIRVKENPVAMASCMVGDHQWMMARDALVLRVEARRYIFVMPGYFYGLSLPCAVSDQECATLEEIFARFCSYRELQNGPTDSGGVPKSDTELWSYAYTEVIKLTSQASNPSGGTAHAPADAATAGATNVSTELTVAKKVQRAVRTSAVVKLISRSLLTGPVEPRRHLHVASAAGLTLPSMSSIAELLDAIENGRQLSAVQLGQRLGRPHDGLWYINPEGIKLLVIILSACSAASARKRPRQQLEGLEEEPEEAAADGGGGRLGAGAGAGAGASEERGASSSNSSRCLARKFEKRVDGCSRENMFFS